MVDNSRKFICPSCVHLVISDDALKAECGELICKDCMPSMINEKCIEHQSHPFEKFIIDDSLKKQRGEVMVRCVRHKQGCRWIGTFDDHAAHDTSCPIRYSLDEYQHESKSPKNLEISTQVMASKYENAYFQWSWRDEMVDGEPVLSGMCAFVSVTAALEASLRLKGHKVKVLSMDHLYTDCLAMEKRPDLSCQSTLVILATILKEKGMVELSPDGEPLKRWRISKFKMFKITTRGGMLDMVNHIRDNGPVVCVHAVTPEQTENNNSKSWGIIHGIPSNLHVMEFLQINNIVSQNLPTHAVCAVGLGSEDMTSFLSYQNTAGEGYQKNGYGRMLPCSVLEALGFFVGEDSEMPLSGSDVMICQQYQRGHKRTRCNTEATEES